MKFTMKKIILGLFMFMFIFSCRTYCPSDINNKKYISYDIFRGEIKFYNDSLFSYSHNCRFSEGKWKIKDGKYIILMSSPVKQTSFYKEYPKVDAEVLYIKFNKRIKIKNKKKLEIDNKVFILQ